MMQACASAAKLRGGGLILHHGIETMVYFGSPPPRIVIGGPFAARQTGAETADSCYSSDLAARCRTQDDALRYRSGRDEAPERDEQLAGQRYDHGLAPLACLGGRPIPLHQGAVLLVDQE